MNPMTARAKRLDNGEWVAGYPCIHTVHEKQIVCIMNEEEYYPYSNEYRLFMHKTYQVDPATLGYETGKRDKNGDMIYGGMEVKAWDYVSIVDKDEDGIWRLIRLSPRGIKRACEYLLRCESSDLEIVEVTE